MQYSTVLSNAATNGMKSPPALKSKILILRAWHAGVLSVGGERVVRAAIAQDKIARITHLLAVGKAAAAMCVGALDYFAENGRALVVTKYGHSDDAVAAHPRIELIESAHPLPDENSLRAGQAVDEFVQSVPPGGRLVMLVSGGASALVERLPDGFDLQSLRGVTKELLAGGYGIEQINAARVRMSCIKGGQLLGRYCGESIRVYAISDVPGDDINLIGSGIGAINRATSSIDSLSPQIKNRIAQFDTNQLNHDQSKHDQTDVADAFAYHAKIIASNRIARTGAADFLREQGIPIIANEESLSCDIHTAAQKIAAALLRGQAGAYIWGGESTIILPPNPGIGGRNQSLALAVAGEIRGRRKISILVAGTDGTDGPTNAAGGLVDGDTFNAASGASNALHKASAGTYLARIAALFKPGPTGTNVMDLAVAIKE